MTHTKRPEVSFALVSWLLATVSIAEAHIGHKHGGRVSHEVIWSPSTSQSDAVSGQGAFRFRVLYGSERLPGPARDVLASAHGGFAVDRRAGRGEIYFALAGAGMLRIDRDLKTIESIATDRAMRDVNLHNTTLWEHDGTPYLSFPANDDGRVFTTALDGELVHTLERPTATSDLGAAQVNEYFRAGEPFTPTDVDHHDGLLYVTTGYSELDWVLTAEVQRAQPPGISWNPLAFGGRGTMPGQFGTGHGVTVVQADDGVRLEIADRPHAEIDRFRADGTYLSTLELPRGAFPCDIDYLGDIAVVGALHGPDRDRGAPVYILERGRVVSVVWPKEELGLQNFQHIHNAVVTELDSRLYIVVQSWNPGDFAVLEQVD